MIFLEQLTYLIHLYEWNLAQCFKHSRYLVNVYGKKKKKPKHLCTSLFISVLVRKISTYPPNTSEHTHWKLLGSVAVILNLDHLLESPGKLKNIDAWVSHPPEIMIYVLGWIWIRIFKSFPSYSNVHPKLRTITLEVPKFKTIWTIWTLKQFHQLLLGIRSMAKWWGTRVTRVRKNKLK